MSVTAHQAEMLRDSFHQMRQRLAPASVAFYEALFARMNHIMDEIEAILARRR